MRETGKAGRFVTLDFLQEGVIVTRITIYENVPMTPIEVSAYTWVHVHKLCIVENSIVKPDNTFVAVPVSRQSSVELILFIVFDIIVLESYAKPCPFN